MANADVFSTLHFPLSTLLLAVDIGNTSTKFGFYEGATLVQRLNFPTVRGQNADEILPTFQQSLHAVIISSVVPELNDAYREFSKNRFNLNAVFVDNSFDFRLKIKYHPPENLGIDRIVAAFAAVEKYGEPTIVCDFGTATTIDAVNSKREFLGGVIAPGMNLLSESLFLKTSKLPQIEIKNPESVIGNSTVKSIESGIYFGYIGLVDGIIERMIFELGETPKIVATGGFAQLIAETSARIEIADDDLMLEGLRLLYEKNF